MKQRRYDIVRQGQRIGMAAALAFAVLALGCGKEEAGPAQAELAAPLSEAESTRGKEACQAYEARACTCAAGMPERADLDERCRFAKAKKSSLDMVLEVNQAPKDQVERIKTNDTARRIIKSCIEEQSELDEKGCKR